MVKKEVAISEQPAEKNSISNDDISGEGTV